jgi:hypothetical protein
VLLHKLWMNAKNIFVHMCIRELAV